MNMNESDRQARLQALAEQAERQGLAPGGDVEVDRHRLVLRALRQPPAARLPADFAARVAARAMYAEDGQRLEDGLMNLLLLGLALAALFYLWPTLGVVLAQLPLGLPAQDGLPDLPWPLLLAGAASLALAWLIDLLAAQRRGASLAG